MATIVWTTSKIDELDRHLQVLLSDGLVLAQALRIIASRPFMDMDVKQVTNGYYNHLHNKKEPYMNRKTTTTSTTTTVTTETIVEEQVGTGNNGGFVGSADLQGAINIINQVNSQIGYYTSRISELEGIIDNNNETVRAQRSEMADLTIANENVSRELKITREMLGDQQQENNELRSRMNSMQSEINRLKDFEAKFNQLSALFNGIVNNPLADASRLGAYHHVELGMERNGNLITLNNGKRY